MLTVINNTRMMHVATVADMPTALAWAETIPAQHDFSIVAHQHHDLRWYKKADLAKLCKQLSGRDQPEYRSHDDLITQLMLLLNQQPITAELPPAAKRVAPLTEETEMATKKRKTPTTKKTAAKKTATKKTPTAKPPKAEKVQRERQNGILRPKEGTIGGRVWAIADDLSKQAGAPAERKDVLAEIEKQGMSVRGGAGYFQEWRRFHGLTKKLVADDALWNAKTRA